MSTKELFIKEKKKYTRVQSILRFLLVPAIKRYYNYEFEDFSYIEGPYLLLANHNDNLDPAFVGMATKQTLSYVATENAFRGKLAGRLLHFIADVIIHKKGKVGFGTVLQMQKRLKAGNSVVLFPEGNRSFNGETMDVDYNALCIMASACKIPIVTFRMEGGYLTHPRWSTGNRRGKIIGKVQNIYKPEELKSNQADSCARIKSDLYTNAFEYQKTARIAYKGKNLALGMESTLFMCPACKEYGRLSSDCDNIYCDCGLKYQYNEYGELIGQDTEDFTILEWDKMQREDIEKKQLEEISFPTDYVKIYSIGDKHDIISSFKAELQVVKGKIFIRVNEEKEIELEPDKIEGFSIFSRNTVNAYYDGLQYEIKGSIPFNALKYLYLYNKTCKGKK